MTVVDLNTRASQPAAELISECLQPMVPWRRLVAAGFPGRGGFKALSLTSATCELLDAVNGRRIKNHRPVHHQAGAGRGREMVLVEAAARLPPTASR